MRGHSIKPSGFSLLELLIAVVILSLLTTIAVPSFSNMQQVGGLTVGVNELAASFKRARSEAVKRAQRVTVCKSANVMLNTPSCDATTSWQKGWIVYVDENENGNKDAAEQLIHVHGELQYGISITTSAIFGANVSYNAMGSTTTAGNVFASGDFTMNYATHTKTLSLSPTGRVRVN